MAVKMRLIRTGKKKQPTYRVIVIDGRSPRDGRYLDQIGRYDPRQEPSLVEIDNEKAVDWLRKGAQPTDTGPQAARDFGGLVPVQGCHGQGPHRRRALRATASRRCPKAKFSTRY